MIRALRYMLSVPRGRLVAAVATVSLLIFAGAASAATQQRSQTVDLRDSKDAAIFDTGDPVKTGNVCDDCIPDELAIGIPNNVGLGAQLTAGLTVQWVNPV